MKTTIALAIALAIFVGLGIYVGETNKNNLIEVRHGK